MSHWLKVYLVPGAVFVSVVLGGGYGTGREVVEYFTRYGMQGGMLGITVATAAFAVILIATFEFARVHQAYDYRTFFQHLLGRWWWLFEILYAGLFLLVLGVVSAAAGDMFAAQTGLRSGIGVALMLLLVVLLVLVGRDLLAGILTYWSAGMYVVFGLYLAMVLSAAEVNALAVVATGTSEPGWVTGGLLYAFYNVAIAPVLLFTVRPLSSRGQTIGAGLLAAVMVMLPAVAFHLSYAVDVSAAIAAPLPNYLMIERYTPDWLLLLFLLALMGTLIETGAGLVQGVVERVGSALQATSQSAADPEQKLSRLQSGLIAAGAVACSALLGNFGIVALIGQGYSLMAVGFALVYIAPLLIAMVRLWVRP